MKAFRSASISITILLILLLTKTDASRNRSIRQASANECGNPNGNTCSFVNCENGGLCIEDSTSAACFKCQCAPGFTGKVCDSSIVILPSGCDPGCQNGGICSGNICLCPVEYSGVLCEKRDYCVPRNPCQNGGRCISTSTNYVCDCTNTGYAGTICTEPITADPCASRPCENGGLCSSTGTDVNCLCVNGYTGTFCQIPPGPCATAPCINGGKCELTAANTYACVCPADFTGNRCETSILENHPCVTSPSTLCLNGGVCTINGADYLCNCAAGWSGNNCQIQGATVPCNPSPCGAYGSCFQVALPTGPTAYCSCENPWTGKYCDVNMDVNCPIGYCLSGGVCRMNGNVPQCDCPPLYTGERCQFFQGPLTTTTTTTTTPGPGSCSPNPCLNGGTCLSSGTNFICLCDLPWTGLTCTISETTITTTTTTTITATTTTAVPPEVDNACSPNPCLNGGICYGNGNIYQCVCQPPWSGFICDVPGTTTTTPPGGNVCSLNPCYNAGVCQPTDTSFLCHCLTPFTGTLCETLMTTTPPITTTSVSMTCENGPCKNGGTCVSIGTSYSCFCGTNSIYTGKNCDSTTPMTGEECPLGCTPGRCIFSGNAQKPYACLWNGVMRPPDGTTG